MVSTTLGDLLGAHKKRLFKTHGITDTESNYKPKHVRDTCLFIYLYNKLPQLINLL